MNRMTLTTRSIITLLAALALCPIAFAQNAAPVRAVTAWNLEAKSKLAIKGYDPVSFFSNAALQGKDNITSEYKGAVYHFATTANRDTFLADPAKYEPAYGGWCAWAMKDGEKVEIDPKKYIFKDGRVYLFYNGFWGDTQAKWQKEDHAAEVAKADAQWKKLTGEEPYKPMAEAKPMTESTPMAAATTLKSQLDEMSSTFKQRAPATTIALYDKGIRDVGSSGVLDTALKVGAKAPEFTLPDATGASVSLSSMLAKGPVVATWYRGGWCPYCNIQLREYQKMLPEMTTYKAQLVALSPQTPDNSLSTQQKDELTFAVLSDKGNAVAKQFGIAYKLPAELPAAFKGKLDLEKFNGDTSEELPLAATYVIAQGGTIRYAFVSEDYTKRAEPADILAALKSLAPTK